MNIWALRKNVLIKHLLLQLSEQLGPNSFVISETSWLADDAVRLLANDDTNMSAYLYTYGQADERYGVHLEYPMLPDTTSSQTVEMQEDLDVDQLARLLQIHFNVLPKTG